MQKKLQDSTWIKNKTNSGNYFNNTHCQCGAMYHAKISQQLLKLLLHCGRSNVKCLSVNIYIRLLFADEKLTVNSQQTL